MSETIIQGDAREVLRGLPERSIHCCITSPPYWGLRDYGIPPTIWGGRADCAHQWATQRHYAGGKQPREKVRWQHVGGGPSGHIATSTAFCELCGAWRGNLGLEPSPQLYVAHILEVMREVWRVLRDDGILWLNLGDCYITKPIGAGSTHDPKWPNARNRKEGLRANRTNSPGSLGLKHKDQVGIPWRVYLALMEDGWYGRRDIVWFKKNPMPESAPDRPTTSHEYVFLLSKKPKYFYDGVAIAEPSVTGDPRRPYGSKGMWAMDGRPPSQRHGGKARDHTAGAAVSWRNKRSVWVIATRPYREAHFATFPEKLVEPCLLAGTSEWGVCAKCGAPWRRVLRRRHYGDWSVSKLLKAQGINRQSRNGKWVDPRLAGTQGFNLAKNTTRSRKNGAAHDQPFVAPVTIGWRPTCRCFDHIYKQLPRAKSARKRAHQDAGRTWWKRARARPGEPSWPVVRATVLDPFAGAGTVGVVARRWERDFVGGEISERYCAMARRRIDKTLPLLAVPASSRVAIECVPEPSAEQIVLHYGHAETPEATTRTQPAD